MSGRVLIVDDEPLLRFMMIEMCAELGIAAEASASGPECLARLTAEDSVFDLIFMDIHMPDMQGTEVLREIRRTGQAPLPKIIAMSADVIWHDAAYQSEAGFDGVLLKPLRLGTVREALRRHAGLA